MCEGEEGKDLEAKENYGSKVDRKKCVGGEVVSEKDEENVQEMEMMKRQRLLNIELNRKCISVRR